MTSPTLIYHEGETELAFWRRKASERALELHRLTERLLHVSHLLDAALVIAVRHHIADDVTEALEMVEAELEEAQ